MLNALTVDVEEYFHPAEVHLHLGETAWACLPPRAEFQVNRILDVFDTHQIKATFFVLGWVAEHHPALINEIAARGHEIGCHSFSHQMVYRMTPAEFQQDTRRAVVAIENACGTTPIAYRAPSYSITKNSLWALEILIENGFRYDSSIYPIDHDRYGIPGFSRHATTLHTPSGPILEVPIATVRLGSKIMPIGGGGYLRLLPYRYTAAGIRRVNSLEAKPVCIYFHPWEIDPAQPRLAFGLVSRLRTYTGIAGMQSKVERLLTEFSFAPMTTVFQETSADNRTEAYAYASGQ